MVPIIALSLIVVAIAFGVGLYNVTRNWSIVGYSYQSLFALVALVMSWFALETLQLVVVVLLALGLLINGLLALKNIK